jgi:hypothetical protein
LSMFFHQCERPSFTPIMFHKQQEVGRVAEWLWASQQLLCSTEEQQQ